MPNQLLIISKYVICALALCVFGAQSAIAQAPSEPNALPDTVQSLLACKDINDDTERLACYDTATGRFETAVETGEVVTVDEQSVKKIEREAFGFNLPSLPKLRNILGGSKKAPSKTSSSDESANPQDFNKETKRVVLTIDRAQTFGKNRTRFFLTNGQIWEQTENRKLRIPKVRDGKPNTVHIKRASLGSYLLRINGKGTTTRVRRVQ